MAIHFHSQAISFSLKSSVQIKKWIKTVIEKEKGVIGSIHYTFCDDKYLLQINQKYLNHNTYTDIITFDYSISKNETTSEIAGDIFISIDRVKENAKKYTANFETELHRVMIHGILHLVGYKDKNGRDKKKMREKEDFYLLLLQK